MHQCGHVLAAACAGLLLLSCAGDGHGPAAPLLLSRLQADAVDRDYAQGRSHYAAGRIDEALLSYRRALSADAGHVNARNGLAVLYAGQGDYGRAIALWLALTADETRSGREASFLFGNLGYAYLLAGDNDRALAALEKACLLDPGRARSWRHLGELLEKMGQGERAARMFRQAEALRLHDAGADYALVRASAAAPMPAGPDAGTSAPALAQEVARDEAPLRIEIRNGNGVNGMAAALARTVGGADLRVVRLGNEVNFMVDRSRIEYRAGLEAAARTLASRLGPLAVVQERHCKAADLCLILGRDLRDPAALRRYYLQQSKPALHS